MKGNYFSSFPPHQKNTTATSEKPVSSIYQSKTGLISLSKTNKQKNPLYFDLTSEKQNRPNLCTIFSGLPEVVTAVNILHLDVPFSLIQARCNSSVKSALSCYPLSQSSSQSYWYCCIACHQTSLQQSQKLCMFPLVFQ